MSTPPRKRRSFGQVRRLRSGRYQAPHVAPDGWRVTAPHTFTARKDAEARI